MTRHWQSETNNDMRGTPGNRREPASRRLKVFNLEDLLGTSRRRRCAVGRREIVCCWGLGLVDDENCGAKNEILGTMQVMKMIEGFEMPDKKQVPPDLLAKEQR